MRKLYYFVHFFFHGLDRNFKIIRYGDVPEHHVKEEANKKYKYLRYTSMPRFIAAIHLLREFFLARHKLYVGDTPKVLYCGSTRNNEREFDFLQHQMITTEVASDFSYSRKKNISFFLAQKKGWNLPYIFTRIVIFLCCLVYLFRIRVNPTSLRFLLRYAIAYYRLCIYLKDGNEKPLLSVFANDHTDISVALSMLMKFYDVPRVYIQHAEVTQDFPALEFEYSILRNRRSLRIYESLGKVKEKVYIIPREIKSEVFENIYNSVVEPVKVVFYLSSIFRQEKVFDAVLKCQENDKISSVEIKKHPRSKEKDFIFLRNIVVHDEIPKYNHIAIVPNSSVVIDLLHRGIKVYQVFELDAIPEDYYGFVENKITPRISIKNLSDKFWNTAFYNEEWRSIYEEYDPSVSDYWLKDLGRLRVDLSQLLIDAA